MTSPQLVAAAPFSGPLASPDRRDSKVAPNEHEAQPMNTERPEPNAELQQSFEPLRTIFALAALLLGLIASLHF